MHVGLEQALAKDALSDHSARAEENHIHAVEHTRRRYNPAFIGNAHRQEKRMPVTHNIKPEKGDVLLLVGTMKGAFILRADESRKKWEIGGPYFPGSAVYAHGVRRRAPDATALWAGPPACIGARCCGRATISAGPGPIRSART